MDWAEKIAMAVEIYPEVRGKYHPRAASRIVAYGRFAYVHLTQGFWAKIDLDDAASVSGKPWCIAHNKGELKYVRTGGGRLKLHQLLMQAPKKMHVDHINGNGLDNTRANLRIVTPGQNQMNKRRQANSLHGTGVTFDKRYGKFIAHIKDGKQKYLGSFSTAEEAHCAYRAEAVKIFGENSYFSRGPMT